MVPLASSSISSQRAKYTTSRRAAKDDEGSSSSKGGREKERKQRGKSRKNKPKNRETAVAADVKASALAAPIPAGDLPTSGSTLTVTLPPTATPVYINPSILQSSTSEADSSLRKTTTVWITPAETAALSAATESSDSPANSSGHLPIYVFALIAIGSTCVGLGVLLVIRNLCIKRVRADRPRPSAPILQDSPLFGGKERFSGRLWGDASFGNLLSSPSKNAAYLGPGKGAGWRPLSGNNTSELTKLNEKLAPSTVSPFADPSPKPMAAALSPASVYTVAQPTTANIGIAVDHPLPPIPAPSAPYPTQPLNVKGKDNASGNTTRTVSRRSVIDTLYGGTEIASPTITEVLMTTASAYQTPRSAPVPKTTPGKPKPALKPSGSSRDRIQPPRLAAKTAPSQALAVASKRQSYSRTGTAKEEEPFMYAIPIAKTQERRDRDTKALTSALGLGSPPAPSSCFSPVSIYPDDSLSVAYGRGGETRPPSEMPSPSGTHAALGDLMLQEFPSVATFASLKTGDPFVGEPPKKKGVQTQTKNGPPRVPSPPPLPSLAQMALANADPDYRSPTYSLYGLYEAERKSKASLGGDRY